MASLSIRDVYKTYPNGVPVLKGVNIDIEDGQFLILVGGSGCGKSTLLRAFSRLLKPTGGDVILDGKAISSYGTKEVARKLGLLPQSSVAPDGISVRDLVARGRYPHQSLWSQWSREDERAIDAALEQGAARANALARPTLDAAYAARRAVTGRIRAEGADEHLWRLVYIARVVPIKGLMDLIESIRILRDRAPAAAE